MNNFARNDASADDISIKNAALALLARREHSKYELTVKLSRKFSDSQKIEQQLTALAENNMQSEERFVESFIRSKKSSGKGPQYIKQQLRQKGISEYLIAAYVYENDENWSDLADDVYRKKYGSKCITDSKDRAKRIRFMVSRGFSADSVISLINSQSFACA